MAKPNPTPRGLLTIHIDESGMNATGTFTASKDAEQLSIESVTAQLKREGVSAGIDTHAIRDALVDLMRKPNAEIEATIARGRDPEQPLPEQVDWRYREIPEDLVAIAERRLSAADPPQIVIEKTERIPPPQASSEKGGLKLFGAKTEAPKPRTRTVHERVYVDTTVRDTGYAEAGDCIGVVEAPQSGRPGFDLSGRPLQPQRLADPWVYTGGGVQKLRGELIAETTGFVRVGANWVDVLRSRPHRYTVELSKDRATCTLSYTPGDKEHPVPDAARIRNEAVELGYREDLLQPAEEIGRLIAEAREKGEAFERVPICYSKDAWFEIFVSEDRMRAVLSVSKGTGRGKPLVLKELGRAIKESRLRGLQYEQIQEDILEFYRGPEIELTGYLLAQGTPPTRGPDRQLEHSLQFVNEKERENQLQRLKANPQLQKAPSFEVFPVENVQQVSMVIKDQRVASIPPPSYGTPGSDVYGKAVEGLPGAEPKVRLFEKLEKKGNLIVSTAEGALDYAELDDGSYLRVRPHRDGEVKVRLANDKLTAYLTVKPAEGSGRPVDRQTIENALLGARVSSGISEQVLTRVLKALGEGKGLKDVPVARGKPPVEGGREELELFVQPTEDSGVLIREDGRADYKNRGQITTVRGGTELARLVPADAEPQPGWDVSGATIAPEQIRKLNLEIGANIEQRQEDDERVTLVATTAGRLLYDGSRIEVQPVYHVQGDVSLQSGNIKFPGFVGISGTVRSGFHVIAEGEIRVGEGVEAALLSADGDIAVAQGVYGRNKGVLRTKGAVRATFIEHCTVLAIGPVTVSNYLMRCEVKSNDSVTITGDKGGVIGGTVRARAGLSTFNLGNERGIRTLVSFGQDYLVGDRIEREEAELEKLKKAAADLDFEMRQNEKDGDEDQLARNRRRKRQLLKEIEKRGVRLFTLRERFEEHYPAEIVVRGTLFPGVVFESHGRVREVTKARRNVTVVFDRESGHIEIKDRGAG